MAKIPMLVVVVEELQATTESGDYGVESDIGVEPACGASALPVEVLPFPTGSVIEQVAQIAQSCFVDENLQNRNSETAQRQR